MKVSNNTKPKGKKKLMRLDHTFFWPTPSPLALSMRCFINKGANIKGNNFVPTDRAKQPPAIALFFLMV